MIRAVQSMHRRSDLSREEFRQYLREHHVPLLLRLPRVQLVVLEYSTADGSTEAQACDAVAEEWFESPEAMQAALASPEAESARADKINFVDVTRLDVSVVDEAPQVAPLYETTP